MLFTKIKSFTHGRKRKGSLKVIMLESTVLILYLKYLYLLCFDLIVVVGFALEIYVCIYPEFFFPQAVCAWEKPVHIKEVCSNLQRSTQGKVDTFQFVDCESFSHTEKMLPERPQKQRRLLISLFPEQWLDIWWTPDME